MISVVFRFQRLWDEEVARVGLEKASLSAVIMRFQKTRFIVSFLASVLFAFAVFLGPVREITFFLVLSVCLITITVANMLNQTHKNSNAC